MLTPIIEATICEKEAQKKKNPGFKLHLDSPRQVGKSHYYEVEPDHDIPPIYEGAVVSAHWNNQKFEIELSIVTDSRTVIVCEEPLPNECKRLTVTIDLTFILEKLIDFLQETNKAPKKFTVNLRQQAVSSLGSNAPGPLPKIGGLNQAQLKAIGNMAHSQFHLLWGPPGTGKTTTLGHFVSTLLNDGKSCLLLAISNAAVDELASASLNAYCGKGGELKKALGKILRYGSTQSTRLQNLTELYLDGTGDNHKKVDVQALKEKLQALKEKWTEALKEGKDPNSPMVSETANNIHFCTKLIKAHQDKLKKISEDVLPNVNCVATTLARCVTDMKLQERSYDVVIVDECSMVPLPYAFVATQLAEKSVVFGGDPKQLPPIVVSDHPKVKVHYGPNIFSYLEIDNPTAQTPICSFLNLQYRMTPRIREIVSDLLYDGALIDGVKADKPGKKPLFINVRGDYSRTLLSVTYKSYFNPVIIPIIKALAEWDEISIDKGSLLVLSPFRPQQALAKAALIDFFPDAPKPKPKASTIHKAQGGQAHTVLVDLTAHGLGDKAPVFFCEETCSHLLNVALSRAQKRLILVGNWDFIQKIAKSFSFFAKLKQLINGGYFRNIDLNTLFGKLPRINRKDWLVSLQNIKNLSETHLIEWVDAPWLPDEINLIQSIPGEQKSIVRKDMTSPHQILQGITIRHESTDMLPGMGFSNGRLLLRHEKEYLSLNTPHSGMRAISIAMAHLYDAFIDLHAANRILCNECDVMMTPQNNAGLAMLKCHKGHQRYCTEKDLTILAALYKVTCPDCGASMVGRTGSPSLFFGCSNYPICTATRKFSYITDGASYGTNKI